MIAEEQERLTVVPGTRRHIDFDDRESLARAAVAIKTLRKRLTQCQDQVRDALVGILDHENERSLAVGGSAAGRVSIPAPTTREIDGERLRPFLEALVDEGVISAEAADRAVHVKYVVNLDEVDKLAALDNEVLQAAIQGATSRVPQTRSLSVSAGRS